MNDKHVAQLATLTKLLHRFLTRIQQQSGNRDPAPAVTYTQRAIADLFKGVTGQNQIKLSRRINRAVEAFERHVYEGGKTDPTAGYIALVLYVRKSKNDGSIPFEEGTNFALVFSQLYKNIDAVADTILHEGDDTVALMERLEKVIAEA